MKMFVKIGFRNLWRNKRRSILTSVVIGLGLAAMIITDGFMTGINEYMIQNITSSFSTEGQVQQPDFLSGQKVDKVLKRPKEVFRLLNLDKNVASYSRRVISFSMISSPRNMENITLYGIDPDSEKKLTNIHKYMVEGDFVQDSQSLIVGKGLLKRLEARLGDKVILTLSKSGDGEITQELFRITGVFKTGSKDLDKLVALVHIDRSQKILGLEKNIHQVAMKFHNRLISEQKSYPLWSDLNNTGNLAESWVVLNRSFVSMMGMMDISKAVVAIILMVLVGLGIVNTLFMAIYERVFEFAVLRALGTKASEVVFLIVSEAVSLAIFSVFVGLVIALALAIPMTIWGIDYGGMEFADVTFHRPVYYVFKWSQYILYPLGTIFFTMIISLYPAIHGGKMTMSEALKRSL
jgi:ABC-type lipoprotein release transport system permease subunit